jgi:F0F1-type ATP synthase membrane subunit c/vacuolar-type H+-ATPase subunit K
MQPYYPSSYPVPPLPPRPPMPPPMQYIPPPISFAPDSVRKTGLQKYAGLIWAGLFILVGIGLGVFAGLSYSKYHHETNKQSQTAKNAMTALIAFGAAAAVCLIIGIIIAFYSVKKLRSS